MFPPDAEPLEPGTVLIKGFSLAVVTERFDVANSAMVETNTNPAACTPGEPFQSREQKLVDWATEALKTTIDIVRKPAEQRGFVVHPEAVSLRT